MKVLVTGGAGFIGSNFVRLLAGGGMPELGCTELVVVDSLTYAGNIENIRALVESGDVRFVRGDIRDSALMKSLLEGVETVFHFAAESHVDRSISNSADFVQTNVVGTHNLLQAALEEEVGKFVLVSTDEVYGSIDSGSWTEDHVLEPNSPYAASKAAADLIARSYHRTHGMPVVVGRASNNYGPYQFPEKLIPLFVTNLLEGRQISLYGDGLNVRDWLHVDDHCRALGLLASAGEPGEFYNIAGHGEMTNEQITGLLLELTGRDRSSVRYVEDRKAHDRRYSLDGTKIERIGYKPSVPISEGLAETVRWYERNRAWWAPLKLRSA
ncbi:dTDP-glucose 4,6-dehydratase [Nocardiopsis dassonvillei]|uniref:dTDP-glucose 4,6-dehydratase n=1 Tax=Nocardiopsis dassonvillei TaxID=2014 RepID=UPI00201050F1|nr:dTDP-glucose 4,6-dehydratase [Nocardiopsis dassonvillei]MCK9868096.1 dTDP-glucose 4,6-dehydratase [Nocardiopsis dassonvillei]